STIMHGSFDPILVALSYLVAVAASYTALELSRRVSRSDGRGANMWLAAGAVSMGIGIWTMHFIGMLAMTLPLPYTYDPWITAVSLVVGIVAAAFAIYVASRKQRDLLRIGFGGVLLGCGIALMHYTGMAAVRMDAVISFDPTLAGISVGIAIAAACAALWIMFTLVDTQSPHLGKLKLGAAMIMGIAICGMHYTGMAAAIYTPKTKLIAPVDPSTNIWLAAAAGIMALIVLGFTHLTIFFERLLKQEREEHQRAEQNAVRLSDVLDETSNEIYFLDSESHRYVHVNRGALKNLGYTMEEMASMTPLDLSKDLTIAKLNERYRPLRNGEESELRFEGTHRRKDGSEYAIQVNLQYSTVTEPPMFVAIVTDISEQKDLELQLVQAKKMESIGQLAAGIAHEINTPAQFVGDNTRFIKDAFTDLTALNDSYARLFDAAKGQTISPELIDQISEAIENADIEYLAEEIPLAIDQSLDGITRISNIVRAMKEFSHPGGKDRESMDLNQAITNTITVASNEWKYVATIETDLAADLPAVVCYQQEINQVILNLIVNAAHAIESGRESEDEEKGTIRITTRAVEDAVEVRISDTGCGIPEEIRDRIFDPFFTTKEVGKGTGQGLAISYKTIVEQHNGFLGVESTPGEGTEFTIRLSTVSENPITGEEAA
ncbi:MAG: PAS domain S-box protein, partial [Woeseiaceae bacterium]|nr:PAS domain S-box protein [Woeseiaceae bacterium]